jgi:hypothetical protein
MPAIALRGRSRVAESGHPMAALLRPLWAKSGHAVNTPQVPQLTWNLGVLRRLRPQQTCENGRSTMAYRVYSGPRGSQSIAPLEKDRQLYKEFSSLDEAIGWARHIDKSGRVALLIEGDDGTRLTKQQIVAALKSPDTGETPEHAA